ncbi:peroxiredoxin family protein [Eisenibacter elegans]|uniref:peroxiredoxin family protein n=1 Tax=Eisenibacter elegans TaxID=997 RepID=UPI0004121C8E|nr:redoxin domain-containing protein [Eisenibacter elegans]
MSKLNPGISAPDFEMVDLFDRPVKLSDYQGKKVFLGFYRNVYCPFCNLRIHQVKKMKDFFDEHQTQVIIVIESNASLVRKSIFHTEVAPVPIICDAAHKLYDMYGVQESFLGVLKSVLSPQMLKTMMNGNKEIGAPSGKDKDANENLMPADFLIDEKGIIQHAYYGKHVGDHIDLAEVKNFVTQPASL